MDIRTLTWTIAIGAAGCGSAAFPPPLATSGAPLALQQPATPEARAEAAVDEIADSCAEYGDSCGSYFREDIYPHLEVPSAVRYFPTSLDQEVRSLGFQLRFDWGGRELEIERGNTLAYNFNEDP